jgi:hypothetical protein
VAKRKDSFKGMDITSPLNRLPPGRVAMAENVRAYIEGGFTLRNRLSDPVVTVDSSIHTIQRLNDTTPDGPPNGYCYIIGTDSGSAFCNAQKVASGLTGNPISILPFRPNTSVQPWAYIGDDAPYPNVTVDSGYACAGMIKVRSDGVSRKMGIMEPQVAPTVSTGGTTTPINGTLYANQVPWTNAGGVNENYNYSQTTPPGTGGVGAPFIIGPLLAGSQSITLTITGSAYINGATHAPGDAGPSGPTYPANFTGAGPKIVVGAFTDGAGNVLPQPSPVPLVVNVGAGITLQVPAGAAQFQLGIDSDNAQFATNTGSFTVSGSVTVSSVATVPSTLGSVTAYVWGDSPHGAGVATYLWRNPNDTGSGISRSIGSAPVTTTNNSWQIDTTPATDNPTALPQWDQLTSSSTVSGEIALFPVPFSQSGNNATNFNACIVGTIFFPTGGVHSLTLVYKDQIMLGIGGGVTASYSSGVAPAPYSPQGISGQTISVAASLPLVFVSNPNGENPQQTTTLSISVPSGGGSFQFEIDWDFWYHAGRTFVMTIDGNVIPPLPAGARTNVSYAYTYYASETGAESNPSPPSSPQITPVLDNIVSAQYSPDPQVDKVNYYRQDEALASYTYVGSGPNTNPPTPIIDSVTDLVAASNRQLEYDNFEPVPSIDLPRSGTCTVSGGVIMRTGGDYFNTRWLPGTVILIGAPPPFGDPVIPQVAYTFIARPTSNTEVTIPGVPDGVGRLWNIAEPILAAQPLAYIAGPTDNINFAFGVGDPLRPGTLYWSKGSNLDAWPDTNQMDVTDPSEPLVNVVMSCGIGVLHSIFRAWFIYPNFFNALATVTGTQGTTWTLQATSINRGLFIPRCLAVEGSGNYFFRVDDGIHYSKGGAASVSITDDDLYPLFVHEGSTPQPVTRNGVTIYPPDDSKPEKQKFSIVNGYLYYDHYGTDGLPHTWVFDIRAGGFIWDTYSVAPTAHAMNEGESEQGTMVGCVDGTLRMMTSNLTEVVSAKVVTAAVGGQGWMTAYEATFEYSCDSGATVSFIAADVGNGSYAPNPIVLEGTQGQITKFTTKVSPSKWKLIQVEFDSTDPTFQLYQEGSILAVKAWGSEGPYVNVGIFEVAGGKGGQT